MSPVSPLLHPGTLLSLLLLVLVAAPTGVAAIEPAEARDLAQRLIGPLPAEAASETNPVTQAKIALGRMLYYETRLSKNQDLSCNSCHALAAFGVDGQPTSPGHRGQRGGRNSPTVYNAALHFAQFWDGRAADVEEQAKGPILNPIEMAMPSEEQVLIVLRSIPGYAPLFAKAFPHQDQPITYDNMARAIGAFERRLMTPSRFDDFIGGQLDALTTEELAGFDLFVTTGCVTCHNGRAVGGGSYQKLGLVKPYETQDTGRFEVTHNDADRYFFKVPSLRNITKTSPYFHDGSIESVEEAVRIMARHQLAKELTDAEAARLVTFLESLTGRIEEEYIAKPDLPPSGPNTPSPDPS